MIGERLVLVERQREDAQVILPLVLAALPDDGAAVVVAIAGESGSGKSGLAHALASVLLARGIESAILTQDDYYRLPPKSNRERRRQDLDWVGPGEVQIDLLDAHAARLKARDGQPLVKPLVFFEEDRIEQEILPPFFGQVVIVEGTYTLMLPGADVRIFMAGDHRATRERRRARGRDAEDALLERVLEIEHRLIAEQRERADHVFETVPSLGDADGRMPADGIETSTGLTRSER